MGFNLDIGISSRCSYKPMPMWCTQTMPLDVGNNVACRLEIHLPISFFNAFLCLVGKIVRELTLEP